MKPSLCPGNRQKSIVKSWVYSDKLRKKTTAFLQRSELYRLLLTKILQKIAELGLSQRLMRTYPRYLEIGCPQIQKGTLSDPQRKTPPCGRGLTVLLVLQPTVNCGFLF